ncbi:MAG: PPOX class F420-dependent oxidoreductase [Chloroflexota bacterium]
MTNPDLAQFDKQSFLSLETYRKNGQGVPTPVWFAAGEGVFYITTVKSSGKVKRIRNNAQVSVAPCNASGGLKGEWVAARARLVHDPQEAKTAKNLLNRKYGLQKRIFDLMSVFNKTEHVFLAVELEDR